MKTAYLSLGGNHMETPVAFLKGFNLIQERIGSIQRISSVYITSPLVAEGIDPQSVPSYFNLAISIKSAIEPEAALKQILEIEKTLGRVRDPKNRYAARLIDIDILLWGDQCIDLPLLTVPHPEMLKRDFVLRPLLDIDPKLKHPITQIPLIEALNSLNDRFIIQKA